MIQNLIVTDAQCEDSLHWLSCADATFSEARKRYKMFDEGKKILLARLSRVSKEKSAKDRDTEAMAQPEYESHIIKMIEAEDEYESIKLAKSYHETRIEVWRTLQANIRKGSV